MSLYAFAAPVLPGKADRIRELAREVATSDEAKSVRTAAGIDRERLYLQDTPDGDIAIVVWDTDDGERALKSLATATDDYSVRFHADIMDIHGIDATDTDSVPSPELIAEWSAPSGHDPQAGDWSFLVPIGRGKVDAYRSMMHEMFEGSQRDGFEQTRKLLGVTRQTMFLLETSMGAFALPVVEGPGAERVFAEQLRRDDHPFFAWWRDQIRMVTGRIPTGPPKVERLVDLVVREAALTRS
jgi:hypothetical protein